MQNKLFYFLLLIYLLPILVNSQHPVLQEIYQFQGWKERLYLGGGLLNPGDLNGDGYDEFVSYHANNDSAMFFWGAFPVDTIPDIVFHERGPVWSKSFEEIAVANIDSDSLLELIIPINSSSDIETFIYKMGANADSVADIILSTGGKRVCTGDFNGDGYDDIVLSKAAYANDKGRIYIYMGADSFDIQYDYRITGDSTGMSLGIKLVSGDLNGDSYDELIVWGINSNISWNYDYIRVYFGSANFDTVYDVQLNDPSIDPHNVGFTHWSLSSFDYNIDGYDDLFVGGFFIYNGSANFDTIPEAHLIWPDSSFNAYAGGNLFNAGDINNDGYPDLAIGMDIMFGGKGLVHIKMCNQYGIDDDYIIVEPNIGSSFGRAIVNIGDIDRNGVSDILIGEPGYILSYLYGKLHFYSGDSTLEPFIKDTITLFIKNKKYIKKNFSLYQNFPNPFNNSTKIIFTLASKSNIEITIYDLHGKIVNRLINDTLEQGNHSLIWDGTTNSGKQVSSGIYFYQLKVKDSFSKNTYSQVKKLIYLK